MSGLAEHIKANKVFHRIGDTINWEPMTIDKWDEEMTDALNRASTGGSTTADAPLRTKAASVVTDPVIADEIPPFDITISMCNEYGKAAVLVIYGVEILNEGAQYSVDNLQSQKACTFVARRIKALEAVDLAA